MKKLLILLVSALVMLPGAMGADPAKQLRKAKEKERKEKVKELKKGGWEVLGSAHTLDVALLSHFNKLDQLGENAVEITGLANNCKSKNLGHQMAINDGCLKYAQRCGSQLSGRILTDVTATNDIEVSTFAMAFERQVQQEIKGEMEESLSIIRPAGDGSYEVQTFFIINEDAASRARMRALENAFKETQMLRETQDKIQDYVRQAVK